MLPAVDCKSSSIFRIDVSTGRRQGWLDNSQNFSTAATPFRWAVLTRFWDFRYHVSHVCLIAHGLYIASWRPMTLTTMTCSHIMFHISYSVWFNTFNIEESLAYLWQISISACWSHTVALLRIYTLFCSSSQGARTCALPGLAVLRFITAHADHWVQRND